MQKTAFHYVYILQSRMDVDRFCTILPAKIMEAGTVMHPILFFGSSEKPGDLS